MLKAIKKVMTKATPRRPATSTGPVPAETTHTLLTFDCGHYQIIEDDGGFIELTKLTVVSPETALKDLSRFATTKCISAECRCSRESCQPGVSWKSWRGRAEQDVADVAEILDASFLQYFLFGKKYHKIPFSHRALFAQDADCALAHEQYAISSKPRTIDPFFDPWTLALDNVNLAKVLLMDQCTLSDVKDAFAELNEARSEIGVIVGKLHELHYAIATMEEDVISGDADRWNNDGLPKRGVLACVETKRRWMARMAL